MSSIFLSHTHFDKPFARKLAKHLRHHGHIVWIDEAEIKIGDSLIEKIRDGIEKVDYVAAVLSKKSIESEWVKRELDIASNKEIEARKVVVLPLLLEDVDLPGFLKGKLYADFRSTEKFLESLDLLLQRFDSPKLAPELPSSERKSLEAQLREAQKQLKFHENEAARRVLQSNKSRSQRLIDAIEKENTEHPEWKLINDEYAFESLSSCVTVGYLLWPISKSTFRGNSPLEVSLFLDDKMSEAKAMITALSDYYAIDDHSP